MAELKKVALVTGANGIIGRAICIGMAERGFEVVMLGRNAERMRQTEAQVRKATHGACLRTEVVDLSRKREVLSFAAAWKGRLDVLINNAAIAPRQRTETAEGIEAQLATNVLGYFWMMQAFASVLKASAPARVVNVASYWAGDLALDDLQFKIRSYDNDTAYRQSKQADRMLTVAFAQRWRGTGVTVNSCHPGDANSTLSNSLGYGGNESPEQAADTPVWLATDPAVEGITGEYFASRRMRVCEFASDLDAIAKLDQICGSF